ncbi:MAG TPA: 3-dehydroquinate synthase [Polyangia bacterium]|jgi:3-dehydroquinate synthase
MITIPVPLGPRAYDVRIGSIGPEEAVSLLAAAVRPPTGVAVIIDSRISRISPRVAPLLAALTARFPNVRPYALPAGEACKNLSEIQQTTEWLAASGFDRGALVVAVGGGATSDHAGFAASIYLRGVPFAIFPTTLLAMVDASVGGKTGVDLDAGKNLVGSFHQPRAVIADLGFLATLPARERVAGLAEVVKSGLIADAPLVDRLEAEAAALATSSDAPALAAIIAAAVKVKADVVTEDEHESGRRAILNFGHTVGHALESESGYELLHGEAVSLGMMAALSLGVTQGVTPPALAERTRRLLALLGLPVDVDSRLSREVLGRIDVDKKRRGESVRFIFVSAPGTAVMRDLPLTEVRRLLVPPAAVAPA